MEERRKEFVTLQKKFCVLGIIGCLCFGIGDWLLGYVDPALADGTFFYFIRTGHGADFNGMRAAVAIGLAAFGMCCLYPGFVHIADIAKDGKTKRLLEYTFGLCSIGWLMLHIIVAVNVFVFSETEKNSGREAATALSASLGNAGTAALACAYLFAAAACILLMAAVWREKTYLKKSAVFFTPVFPMAVLAAVSQVLPDSPFSYGLYTFCMNGGMLVWFVYLLLKGSEIQMKSRK